MARSVAKDTDTGVLFRGSSGQGGVRFRLSCVHAYRCVRSPGEDVGNEGQQPRFTERLCVLILQVMAWTYFWSPRLLQRLLGWCVGQVFSLLKYRRSVVIGNLELAYPGDDTVQRALRADTMRQNYAHMGHLLLEIMMHFGPMRRFVEKRVTLVGVEHWRAAHAEGRGVILLGSHMGNWEVMSAAICVLEPTKSMMVTKHLKPEWLHRALEASRTGCGIRAVYEPKLWNKVLADLKRNGTVGYVLDQYAGHPIGVRVPYFGVPVGTNSAVAAYIRESGAQLVPITNYRLANGDFVVELLPPVAWISDPHPQKELALNTAQYVKVIEETVRRRPGQWLWTHRRFKGDLSPLCEADWTEFRSKSASRERSRQPQPR